ncbi:hypothetical protein ACS0TY_026211 [Phlomoides rotata]
MHTEADKILGSGLMAFTLIGKEGLKGYWKGNLPQVIRIIPYSAVQLFAYETYKKLFRGPDGELSVLGRLAAGACAGMTSTFFSGFSDTRLDITQMPPFRDLIHQAPNFEHFLRSIDPPSVPVPAFAAAAPVSTSGHNNNFTCDKNSGRGHSTHNRSSVGFLMAKANTNMCLSVKSDRNSTIMRISVLRGMVVLLNPLI